MGNINADIKGKDWERGIIKDAVIRYYDERLDIGGVSVDVVHREMNRYDATVTYTDIRVGKIVAHYTVLLKDGNRVEFQ